MEIPYYPGCTLKRKAQALDRSTVEAFRALGVDLKELPRWSCCGAVYPLTTKRIAGLAAPIRTLRDVQMLGADTLVTSCAFCYNVLKRANQDYGRDPLTRKQISAYIADDVRVDEDGGEKITTWPAYEGQVQVMHVLELLRDRITFDRLAGQVKRRLRGFAVAPYYGCTLLRPAKVMKLDDPERPVIMQNLLRALGAEPVDFPFFNECCGSFQCLSAPSISRDASRRILASAWSEGARALAVSCPLCFYNLDQCQAEIQRSYAGTPRMPVFYITELVALAMDVPLEQAVGFPDHAVDVRPLLAAAGWKSVASDAPAGELVGVIG